jgi:hypothetical protein
MRPAEPPPPRVWSCADCEFRSTDEAAVDAHESRWPNHVVGRVMAVIEYDRQAGTITTRRPEPPAPTPPASETGDDRRAAHAVLADAAADLRTCTDRLRAIGAPHDAETAARVERTVADLRALAAALARVTVSDTEHMKWAAINLRLLAAEHEPEPRRTYLRGIADVTEQVADLLAALAPAAPPPEGDDR